MKLLNVRLCSIGSGRGFYVPQDLLSDDYINEHFDLTITPHVELTSEQQSVKQKLLDLMNQHPDKTWLIQEFAGKATKWLNLEYNESKKYIERLLTSIPEITKAGDARYRLLIA